MIDFVDRWPGQEDAMHLARVPTAILYDEEGKVSTTPSKMFRVSMPHHCGRAISWWLAVPKPLPLEQGIESVHGTSWHISRCSYTLLSTRQLSHGRSVRVCYQFHVRIGVAPLTRSACRSQAGPTPKDLRRLPQVLAVAYPIFLAGSYRTRCVV